jgi:uncharacterized protein YlxW (UPF0749 family)
MTDEPADDKPTAPRKRSRKSPGASGPPTTEPVATDAADTDASVVTAIGPDAEPAPDAEADATAEPAPTGEADATAEAHDGKRPAWRAFTLRGAGHPVRGQFVVALLCALLGFALVTQVDSKASSGLTTDRPSDLIDVLDNLNARSEQLDAQIATEQNNLDRLTGGNDKTNAALQEAQQQAQTLRILAGTAPATGPGIDLLVQDPTNSVTADVMLGVLEELRDAGAEAVEIKGGAPQPASTAGAVVNSAPAGASSSAPAGGGAARVVRLVASSYFLDSPDAQGIVVDGTVLAPPYDVVAIGDPPTMAKALGIPGGVLATLKDKGASGVVTQHDAIQLTALHTLHPPQYARPAPTPSASG